MSAVCFLMRKTSLVDWGSKVADNVSISSLWTAFTFLDNLTKDAILIYCSFVIDSLNKDQMLTVDNEELILIKEALLRNKPAKYKNVFPVIDEFVQSIKRIEYVSINPYLEQVYFDYNNSSAFTATAINSSTSNSATELRHYQPTILSTLPECYIQTQTNSCLLNIINNTTCTTTAVNNYYNTNLIMTTPLFANNQNQTVISNLDMIVGCTSSVIKRIGSIYNSPNKEKRKNIRRQMDLLSRVLSNKSDMNVFLSGQKLIIESEKTKLKYSFTKKDIRQDVIKELTQTTHYSSPYLLEVFSKDNVYLTKLCVYVQDTPLLDQLSAMILYIQSGEETSLLKTANFYSIGNVDVLNAELNKLGLLDKIVKPHVYYNAANIPNLDTGIECPHVPNDFEIKKINYIQEDSIFTKSDIARNIKNLREDYFLLKGLESIKVY